jgi:hypothetical protein
MSEQIETTRKEITTFEEYLSVYFPQTKQNKNNVPATPEEIGMTMAEETLLHIQNLLLQNKKG